MLCSRMSGTANAIPTTVRKTVFMAIWMITYWANWRQSAKINICKYRLSHAVKQGLM